MAVESVRIEGPADLYSVCWVVAFDRLRQIAPQYWAERDEVRQRLFRQLAHADLAGATRVLLYPTKLWLREGMRAEPGAIVLLEPGVHLEIWYDREMTLNLGNGRPAARMTGEELHVGVRTERSETWTVARLAGDHLQTRVHVRGRLDRPAGVDVTD